MSPAESQPKKSCVGAAGFVVLDIVEPLRGHPRIYLHFGGTAGNVAMILGALGWQSYPFARLPQDDPAFPILAEDLRRFGICPDFVTLAPAGPLPALVQRKRADGSDQPLFTFRCPRCSAPFFSRRTSPSPDCA